MSLIGLLVLVLVFVLILWLVRMIPDATIQKVAMVVVIVIAVLYLLHGLGLVGLNLQKISGRRRTRSPCASTWSGSLMTPPRGTRATSPRSAASWI